MLSRLLDDWHRRRLEGSRGTAQQRLPRLGAGPLLRLLVGQVAAFLVASIRFLTVASSPTAAAVSGSAQRPDVAPSRSPAAQGSRKALVRLLAIAPPVPHLDGAHPISDAAMRRSRSIARGVGSSARSIDLTLIRRAAPTLVLWLRPIGRALGVALGVGSSDTEASTTDSPATGEATMVAPRPTRLGSWLVQQRLVGGAVAVLVLVASVIGVSPVHGPLAATGNVLGAGSGPRLSIGGAGVSGGHGVSGSVGTGSGGTDGGFGGLDPDPTPGVAEFLGFANAAAFGQNQTPVSGPSIVDPLADGLTSTDPSVTAQNPDPLGAASFDVEAFSTSPGSTTEGIAPVPAAIAPTTDATNMGAFLSDGTILKPIAVDTSAPDARTLLTHYKVRTGDTLTSIAHHFGLSLQTVFWANHLTTNLKTKTDLKIGQTLSIPPVNGVLHVVTDKETLSDISKRTGISVSRIVQANGLKQPTVFVGQWILVPGAKSKPVPEPAPKPVPKPVAKPTTSTSTSRPSTNTSSARPAPKPVVKPIRPVYSSGGWAWPVPGGFISQYFHYGHWALDIADTWGDPVLAAHAGVVTFAGWKNNGGGWQVWMSHGNGIYTTYNHMSSLTVAAGQYIAAGHQVGRIGMTGDATGPHCHFEVWIGPIWAGGTRVNPLNYV